MPRETVYGDQPANLDPVSGRTIVQVGWDRDEGAVQIVSKCVDTLGGRLVKDDPGIHYTDGMWVNLDRRGINDLIRHLRRARDSAFGRDE